MKLKIAYFGTPDFSARLLEKLILDKNLPVDVVLVVTQPDKPVGRKKILTPSPVKLVAKKYKLAGVEPGGPPTFLRDIDLCLLYAFGEIIPISLLQIPKYGFWNIHPSLLPKFRGPAPMAYPLLLGEKETGVTLMKMDNEVDHGPIIAQEKYQIKPDDKRSDLEKNLTDLGFELLKQKVKGQLSNVKCTPQDETHATYTRQLIKQDGFIPLSVLKKALNNETLSINETPEIIKEYRQKNNLAIKQFNNETIYNLFRGLYPWPGLWTKVTINGAEKRLKLTEMGLSIIHDSKFIIQIKRVQLEGKTEVDFEAFNKVYNIF